MGIFTWKMADDGRKKLPYGGKGYVVCPDDTYIEECHYNGYGIFAGKDIYDLVVDWNKSYLNEIVDRIEHDKKHFGVYGSGAIAKLARAYSNDDSSKIEKIIKETVEQLGEWFRMDWKRNIGIMIACKDENNDALPYPIKIVSKPTNVRYADLPSSKSTQ